MSFSSSIRPVLYALTIAASYYYTYYDASHGGYQDSFLTEFPQELILFIVVILHAVTARKFVVGRTLNIALGGLALASLIREHNNQLAELVFAKAWAVLAVPVLVGTAVYCWRHRQALLKDYYLVKDTFGFGVLMTGLLILHIFTRLWGANDLWHATMGEDYMRVVARTSEEGLELMAYSVILLGTVELITKIRHLNRNLQVMEMQ